MPKSNHVRCCSRFDSSSVTARAQLCASDTQNVKIWLRFNPVNYKIFNLRLLNVRSFKTCTSVCQDRFLTDCFPGELNLQTAVIAGSTWNGVKCSFEIVIEPFYWNSQTVSCHQPDHGNHARSWNCRSCYTILSVTVRNCSYFWLLDGLTPKRISSGFEDGIIPSFKQSQCTEVCVIHF